MSARSTNRELKKRVMHSVSPWGLSLVAAGLLVSSPVNAADFSQYTTEELVQMRTQSGDMSEQDREQFRQEMQLRTKDMSPEARQNLGLGAQSNPAAAADRRLRTNEDNDRGRGELTRQRSRTESGTFGYGYGYERRQSQGGFGSGMGGGGRGGGGRGR